MTAYTKGDYNDAVEYLEKAFELNPQDSTVAHNIACCYALMDDKENAIYYIEEAFKLGSCLFIEDEDLKALHEEPKFAELTERAKILLGELKDRTWIPEITLPPGFDSEKEYPWIIALHGFGSNPELFSKFLREGVAETRVILCCPYATIPKGTSSFSWTGYLDDERTIISAYNYLKQNYNLQEKEGTILGYSQGGSRALYIGLKYPEMFRGIIVLAGYYDEEFNRYLADGKNKTKVYMVIGSKDGLLKSNLLAKELMKGAGLPVKLVVCPGLGHTAPPVEEVVKAMEWIMEKKE